MPTVLVVDDDADSRRLLQVLLGSRQYDTVVAADGKQGLEAARALIDSVGGPDAVLLDLHMPVLDGHGFLAEWTSDPAFEAIPVLMVTADITEMLRSMDAGAHDYVTKPFDLEELLARLAAALRVKSLYDRLRHQRADMEALSSLDSLTGLANRQGMATRLEALAHAASRHGHPLSLLLADLEGFQWVNDENGRGAGEHVLREVGRRVRCGLRHEDEAGRWDGGALLVALPFTDSKGAGALAERLRVSVAEQAFPLPGGGVCRLTMSVGGATGDGTDLDGLIRRADAARAAARAAGGNAVRLAAFP